MLTSRLLKRVSVASVATVMPGVLLMSAAIAGADSPVGNIDHVESQGGTVRVLFSIDGLPDRVQPDLGSARVSVDGRSVKAKASPFARHTELVSRTAVLVIDASKSMAGERLAGAKAAALAFLNQAPADVKIGLVTFADTAKSIQAPTTDRDALRSAIENIELSRQTHLYDGIAAAMTAAGKDGQRRLLVLTDGHDTTNASLDHLTSAIGESGDRVDVVGLAVTDADVTSLDAIARAGNGNLVNAADTAALHDLFRDEAEALADQVLVVFRVPASKADSEVNLVVSIMAEGTTYSDAAFVSLGSIPSSKGHTSSSIPFHAPPTGRSKALMIGGISAVALAIMLVAALGLGLLRPESETGPTARIAGYGRAGKPKPIPGTGSPGTPNTSTVRDSAIDLASKAIGASGFDTKLQLKLDAAGIALRPPEWVLLHVGVAVLATFVGFLLTGGRVGIAIVFLLAGTILPWVYLGFREKRRVRGFTGQLPEALNLMAGGLKAGLSLTQSIDTIVREGTEPMAGEFRRVLIEARLGVSVEDAMDGLVARMKSKDFEWVVMAIRIHREIGGNLSEILLTVSSTLREREFLRRQVRALSAEGRLSAWVLGLMPPGFLAYLALTNRASVALMFHTGIGLALMVVATVLMAFGTFWMSRIVKVEA